MKKFALFVLVSALILSFSAQVLAKAPTDPRELEAFFDGIMAAHLKEYNIPGATLSVVKDGRIFLLKGYGYADVEKKKPVDPAKTLFRPGSTSKLFTWTAVMQMVEQGKIDLKADVNKYLSSFKIPQKFGKPVTIENLMTHTAGFEDRFAMLVVGDYKDFKTLHDWLVINMPARVWPPGERSVYSNYGTSLAGYIVEKVSNMPFNHYVEKHIFRPLNMNDSTFDQKQTEWMKRNSAAGYVCNKGKFYPQKFEFHVDTPAGSASSTARDMANFMIAHLNLGRFGGTRILKERTAKNMHKRHFTYDDRVNGMCLGFIEESMNGKRIIAHGGDTIYFHSQLVLLPEENLGIFVSYNAPGGSMARDRIIDAFMAKYYPAALTEEKAPKDFEKTAKKLKGTYEMNRRNFTTFEKARMLYGSPLKVEIAPENSLFVSMGAAISMRLVPLGGGLFRGLYDDKLMAFKEIGGRTHALMGNMPVFAFEKMRWYETASFHWIVFWCCALVFLSSLIAWPLIGFLNWRRGVKLPWVQRFSRWASGSAALLFLAGFALLRGNLTDIIRLTGLVMNPARYILVFLPPILGALLTVSVLIFTYLSWRDKYFSLQERIYYSIVTFALVVHVWWLNWWNLLGFKL